MGEVGCSKDGSFQNIEVNGFASISNTKTMVQQKVIYSRLSLLGTNEEKIFWLPPRSFISSIEILCVESPVIPSGGVDPVANIGFRVGDVTTGSNIVGDFPTAIISGLETDGVTPTPAGPTGALSGLVFNASIGRMAGLNPNPGRGGMVGTECVNITPDPKPIYLQLTNNNSPQGEASRGNFAWIVSYKQF
tara:strand:- start:22 stop:594 length:573 start_codon:yes stop_codon:yes gene_type:complete